MISITLITALFSKPETHLSEFNGLKFTAFNALERSRADRTNSIVLETLNGGDSSELSDILDDDSDLKSDAESSCCLEEDIVYDSWEDEQSINELVCEEGTIKRLELLAGMVGVDNTEPEVVLAEVVRVLKDLERLNGSYLLHKSYL
ncbi:hypothetical protein ACB092_01G195700 [Castanea dentata]